MGIRVVFDFDVLSFHLPFHIFLISRTFWYNGYIKSYILQIYALHVPFKRTFWNKRYMNKELALEGLNLKIIVHEQ